MSLFGQLEALGRRLKIIEADPGKPNNQVPKVTTRNITLGELTSEVRAEDVRALAELPAELSVDFEKVFQAAGVKPDPNGWTIERLKELLGTEPFKNLDRSAAQKALLAKLAEEKVQVEDLVKDAVARDRALDAFATFVRKKMDERKAARQRKITEKEAQIRALQDECVRQNEENKADDDHWKKWHRKKADYEKDLARAVGYLLEKPVISVDEEE
jgi:hypothetical protein